MQKGTRELNQEGMPRVVCHTTTLHSGSIFGMHEMDGRMATASEDGLGISAIRETMIFMEKCITSHHTDVIRHVRFRYLTELSPIYFTSALIHFLRHSRLIDHPKLQWKKIDHPKVRWN